MVISVFVQGLARAFLSDHNELNSLSLSLSLPLLSGGVKCGSYIGRMDQQEPNSGNYNQVRAGAKCGPCA